MHMIMVYKQVHLGHYWTNISGCLLPVMPLSKCHLRNHVVTCWTDVILNIFKSTFLWICSLYQFLRNYTSETCSISWREKTALLSFWESGRWETEQGEQLRTFIQHFSSIICGGQKSRASWQTDQPFDLEGHTMEKLNGANPSLGCSAKRPIG